MRLAGGVSESPDRDWTDATKPVGAVFKPDFSGENKPALDDAAVVERTMVVVVFPEIHVLFLCDSMRLVSRRHRAGAGFASLRLAPSRHQPAGKLDAVNAHTRADNVKQRA
jgi:hypothetical protein